MAKSRTVFTLAALLFVVSATAQEFPMRCQGSAGMASSNGKNLIIDFKAGDHPAGQALAAGQCSWLDRGIGPNEPRRIVNECRSPGEAENSAKAINSGGVWTFWVSNSGRFLRSTAYAKGTPKWKPQSID